MNSNRRDGMLRRRCRGLPVMGVLSRHLAQRAWQRTWLFHQDKGRFVTGVVELGHGPGISPADKPPRTR